MKKPCPACGREMTVLAGGGLQKHKAHPRWKLTKSGYIKTEYDGPVEPWCPQVRA